MKVLRESCSARDEFGRVVELFPMSRSKAGDDVPRSYDHQKHKRMGRAPAGGPRPMASAGARVVDFDVSWMVPADLRAVDVLVRLQLIAARRGCWLQLHGVAGGLAELFEFCGLGDVVHVCGCCSTGAADPGPQST